MQIGPDSHLEGICKVAVTALLGRLDQIKETIVGRTSLVRSAALITSAVVLSKTSSTSKITVKVFISQKFYTPFEL